MKKLVSKYLSMHKSFLIFLILTITLIGCKEESSVGLPKPRMYPRIFYPESGNYTKFDTTFCSFTFKYPAYSKIVQDSFYFQDTPLHPCWFNINIPALNATLHCSYYNIDQKKSLSSLVNDAFEIAGKHNIKANYRRESVLDNRYGVKGIMFEIDGPVASPAQFYLTDENKHFFRASLYFNSKVNPDSTAAVLAFLKPEIDTILSTFQWK